MKISFVIPAHNEEMYIGDCLDSIEREIQNAPCPVEIIVVDNASSDKTGEVARSHPNVTVIDEPRKGIVWARKAGFLASTGDIIANVDADSRLTKNWLKKVAEEFSKDPNLVALSGPFILYDLPPLRRLLVRFWYWMVFISQGIIKFFFGSGAFLQGGNYVLRRNALEKIGGYDTNIQFYGEDSDIGRRIIKTGKVKFTFKLPMYSSARRLKEEGTVTTAFRYVINYFWILIFKKPFHMKSNDIRHESKTSDTSAPKNITK